MASTARPMLLRQTQLLSASRRLFHASSAAPSSRFLQATTSSILSRQLLQSSQLVSFAPRSALFSTSTKKSILPPGPQVISGGVNDAQPIPRSNPLHGSYHWTAERLISVALIPLTIAPFAGGSLNPTLDAVFVAAMIIHSHIGFQACIIDYFPTPKHSTLRTSADWLLNIFTVLVCVGFYEFETNDVGIVEGVKRIWHAGANDATVAAADVSKLGHDGKLKHLK